MKCENKFWSRIEQRKVAVEHVPQLQAVRERFPGADFKVSVSEGDRLGKLEGQDSYSYELANILLGANSRVDLLNNYDRALEMLPFEVDGRRVAGHVSV